MWNIIQCGESCPGHRIIAAAIVTYAISIHLFDIALFGSGRKIGFLCYETGCYLSCATRHGCYSCTHVYRDWMAIDIFCRRQAFVVALVRLCRVGFWLPAEYILRHADSMIEAFLLIQASLAHTSLHTCLQTSLHTCLHTCPRHCWRHWAFDGLGSPASLQAPLPPSADSTLTSNSQPP